MGKEAGICFCFALILFILFCLFFFFRKNLLVVDYVVQGGIVGVDGAQGWKEEALLGNASIYCAYRGVFSKRYEKSMYLLI